MAPLEPAVDADEPDPAVFAELFDLKEPPPKPEPEESFKFVIPKLPPLLTQTLLPWALSIGCLGYAGYIGVSHVLHLPGRVVGFAMIAAALLLYAALLIPITLKYIHSAAITAKLRLPNDVYFQTFSLFALPTAAMVFGYEAGGGGASIITFGILGLAVATVLMAFMFRADVMQTLLTVFYAGSAYVGSSALCAGILVGVGLILNRTQVETPWYTPPVEIAEAPKPAQAAPPPQAPAPAPAPVVVAPKPVEQAPVIVQAAPKPALPAGPPWRVTVEPLTAASMWPAIENRVRESIEVHTPLTTVHPLGAGPFVALLEPQITRVFDLRTGKRSGFIKAAFQPAHFVLSPDGSLLAAVETPDSLNRAMIPTDAPPGTIEIWSTANNQMIGRVPSETNAIIPTPMAFAGTKLVAIGSSNGATGLQVWDPATGLLMHQWSTPTVVSKSSIAISNSGQFIAAAIGPVVRLFNSQTGDIAGELPAPAPLEAVKGLAFSPDGRTLAALVPGDFTGNGSTSIMPATLFEWTVADGKLARSVPIDLSATKPPFSNLTTGYVSPDPGDVAALQWTPDGRMVRIAGGLFEVTSGKSIYTLAPEMSGNLSGRIASVENRQATYEFLPTGLGTRLVLKSVDLPTATIDSAVAFAAACVAPLHPAPGSQDAGASPTTPPGGDPTASAPTTAPAYAALLVTPQTLTSPIPRPTPELAAQGKWDVQIKSIAQPDPSSRAVAAVMDNGIPLQITADSDATVAIVDFMRAGDRVRITGTGQLNQNMILVKLRAAAPITAAPITANPITAK